MIEFERTNQKGDKLKAYTHRNYLSSQYNSQLARLQQRNKTWSGLSFYGTGILTYWALHNVSILHTFVQNKLSWKGKFLIVSAAVGLIDSLLVSTILAKSYRNTQESLLKRQSFPAWLHQDRVVNPDRVFFQLDDNHHNEPTIWHSSITESAISRIIPDFVVGSIEKPHYPVAQHHHH